MWWKSKETPDPVCETLAILADAFRYESTVASTPVAVACTALAARLEEAIEKRKPLVNEDKIVETGAGFATVFKAPDFHSEEAPPKSRKKE